MDARDLLRRYIEQRRELGESELVLDRLNVDEVMKLLGAAGGGGPVRGGGGKISGDWRASLREAGVAQELVPPVPPPSREPAQLSETPAAAVQPDVQPEQKVNKRLEFPAVGVNEGGEQAAPALRPGLVVGGSEAALFPGAIGQLGSLEEIAQKVKECRRCPLYATATHAVPGEGNSQADLVCVGEAPGANEDATGRPFVGAAGQLLTRILAAIDLPRENVFIVNVLKHRPPGNRNPRPEEVEACSPYLVRQLEIIKPKVIVAFGTFAAQTLLETKTPLGQLRGFVHRYHGTPLIVTFHPAALLRNPAWKRPTWEDVKLARRILDSAAGA
ncbi:MAG TPA: uracil-DNA glycosylase [Gemmatimonadaceae bacterium]|nr:uracil-DNA glycosylase [Gemmatimonadaceae bacterium]